MRLFRATHPWEDKLNSHSRAFGKEYHLLDEIYSHVMFTHKMVEDGNKTIYSFTDDIAVARRFCDKYPESYCGIGYADVDMTNRTSAFIGGSIKLVKPIYRVGDWVDLAAYCLKLNEKQTEELTVKCLNYAGRSTKLICTLVPSHNGALSLAREAREYAVICENLRLTMLSDAEIETEQKKRQLQDYELLLSDEESRRHVVKCLQNDLKDINIHASRRKYLDTRLSKMEKELTHEH